ncbi:hypothetical protein [Okeania sp.]|uniref:hypothetical protein n=1 Tax=Okeania sp. TaxID=3100323 RepID=UPI002B4B1521|nr:hypothetical protein [Okeania sp.]MEB3343069.1 hypothetical protein [Okeania sp.]
MRTKEKKLLPKNKLLVEGAEEKRVIPYLIEANGISTKLQKSGLSALVEWFMQIINQKIHGKVLEMFVY